MVHSTFVRHVHIRSLNAEQRVDRTKFKLFACPTDYKSVDDKEWVCKTCGGALASGKITGMLVANGLKFPEIPDELKLIQFELVHWKRAWIQKDDAALINEMQI